MASSAQESSQKTVRVGWYESNYCRTDTLGRRTGLVYEYQRKIAAYTGWTYEYVDGNWADLYKMLENGEIDLLSDISYRKDREKNISYPSLPMGTESYYIYINADNTSLSPDDLGTFNGKTFGVNAGTLQETFLMDWAKENGLDIETEDTGRYPEDEQMRMLMQGKMDALVSMDTHGEVWEAVPLCKIGSSDYYFAVNKNRPDLLSELNSALNQIQNENPNFNRELYEKFIASVKSSALISSSEKEWLEGHKTISLGYRNGYLPFCDTDSTSGELSGVLKDYVEQASTCLNNTRLDFESVAYPTVADSVEALKNYEVDCIFPVMVNPYEGEDMGILTTFPLMSTEVYIVVRNKEQQDFPTNEELTVAIPKGHVNFETFIRDYYPQWKIDTYDSDEDCYYAVADKEADCLLVSSYRINKLEKLRNRYKLSLIATGERIDLSFAVREEDRELYSILNKTIHLIPATSTEYAISKYSYDNEKVSFLEFLRDNLAAAVIVGLLVAALILSLLHQKKRAQKQAEERQELIRATELEPLTSLYNRSFFYEYANRMYNENPELPYDAIVLNIEQFHMVNALYGLEFGDQVLKTLGDEIHAYLDESDGIACKTDADHFELYCRHTDDYQKLLDRFQRKLDEFSTTANIRVRMGVMPWQEGIDPVQLFERAATACNRVRNGHLGSLLMVYNEDMRKRELREQKLLQDLRRALCQHEFVVYYQPKYNIQTNPPQLCSAEALVRWQHPELGMIPPFEFISLFERECQISLLDQYVWREAARQIAQWRDRFGIVLPISVNLSRVDVFDPNLEATLDNIITENGLRTEDLHLEVTESAYTEEANQVINIVSRLREKGYRIEMDDFGTGYSSLNMLSSMPIDILKLDRSFVIQIFKDEKVVHLVELILDIARVLHVPVVAEGVETENELEFLNVRGCEMVQGYYFSKPLPAAEFEHKLQVQPNG